MKILIIANNQKWKSWDKKIQELEDWFAPALDLEFDIVHTKHKNIPFSSYGIHDDKERFGIDKKWFADNIQSKDHEITIFSVNRKDWGGFPVEGWQWGGKSIAIASDEKGSYNFKGVRYAGEKWFNLARHELCHALYTQQGKFDRTHFHWDSGDLSKVLPELKNTIPTVLITRNGDDGVQTLGTLELGWFKCNTLERPWKNNAPNISCIPKGEYTVKWTFSPKFMRYTYEVQNVPKRSGIRFHTGNFVTDISGCFLLGNGYKDLNKDGRLDIINSTATIKAFEQLLNKQEFKLIIK
ncbi:hypothetical protein E6Q11_07060 [Candidatus Dojkabacteria bacterium]|uniref:DUF5675 domain-containing protein n=1 Tax=Candidatus Dojkabacteria bacterium TaxID=2099670 RepID=A0A5C7J2H3_9BACT|nr:MAG: hypothetical protein E6Q11_07060 [Candidatus Dojkabacteria bacterium]